MSDPRVPTPEPNKGIPWRTFFLLLLVNVVVLVLGIASTFGRVGDTIGVAGLAVALVIIGVFTFLLLFYDVADLRSAITVAFVFVYFSLMGASLNEEVSNKFSTGFGEKIFESFDTLMAIVIGFYFGGKALEFTASRLRSS